MAQATVRGRRQCVVFLCEDQSRELAGTSSGYNRNDSAFRPLEEYGIEVVSLRVAELVRGRGNPRSMTCPLRRDAV